MALSAGAALRYPSPLRYPGGKGKVANFMKLILLKNGLVGARYTEPYAGGASVALSLLFEDLVADIHINDIDPAVYEFWRAVLYDTELLCKRIFETPVSVAEWKRQKAVQSANDPDPLDLAFSTFFLNRTNRSGIIAGGGVIGGFEQKGVWGIAARYNKLQLIQRVKKVARFQTRITLTKMDASDLLCRVPLSHGQFIYLDPPYYRKGPMLYANFYEHHHHVSIAGSMKKIRAPWIVSYDLAQEITNLYRWARCRKYQVTHSAGEHRLGWEVMFFSPDLLIPRSANPAGVRNLDVDLARANASV